MTNLSDVNPQDLNLQYAYYMDLEEKRDVEITVGFVSDTPLKFNTNSSIDSTFFAPNMNGFLCVTPFTELTTPSIAGGNDEIEINVYVRSDNMTFSGPKVVSDSYELSEPELLKSQSDSKDVSSFQPYAKQVNNGQGIKVMADNIVINKTVSTHEGLYKSYIGEEIVSFRSLLKRVFSNATYMVNKTINPTDNMIVNIFSDLYPHIAVTNSITVGGVTEPEQFIATFGNDTRRGLTSYDRLRRAFLFQKGGMRHKFTFHGDVSKASATVRHDFALSAQNRGSWMANGSLGTGAVDDIAQAFSGTAYNVYDLNINKVVEIEAPFYNQVLMIPTMPLLDVPLRYPQDVLPLNMINALDIGVNYGPVAVGETRMIDHSCSIAEDFSFHRFQGATFIKIGTPTVVDFTYETSIDTGNV
jgi:hypothetical protein